MSTKAERRKEQRKMNYKVLANVTSYLMGPKVDIPFTIDCSKKTTNDRILRVNQGYGDVKLSIYFGNRIRISVSNEWYEYYDEYEDATLPDDVDEYIHITTAFLRELIRHDNMFRGYLHGIYFSGNVPNDLVINAPDVIREVVESRYKTLSYHWTWKEREYVEYITKCMQDRRYRRARGDYRS